MTQAHQMLDEKQNEEFVDRLFSILDKEILLKYAKEKGLNSPEDLENFIKARKAVEVVTYDAFMETIRNDPKAAEMIKKLLEEYNKQIFTQEKMKAF